MPAKNKPRNDGAIVAYDEEQASKPRPKKKKPRQPPPVDEIPPPKRKHRPRDDDNVSAVSEAEYAHDPDDEPQFKYSTAELADSSWRSSTCCIITMVILCVILAIVLSVVLKKVFDNKNKQNQAPPPTFAPTTLAEKTEPGISMFKSPTSVIDNKCSQGNAISAACQTACEGFACCDPLLPANQSCFHFNEQGCLNYKRCQVTNSGVGVPSPLLEQYCTPATVAASPKDCQNLCSNVACCWQSNITCYDKTYMCLDYAPCLNLRSNYKVPAAPIQVADYCDPTIANSLSQGSQCQSACKPAECCWNSDPTLNCLQTDFLACMTYAPCGKLELPAAGNHTFLPPTSITTDCSIDNIKTGDTTQCTADCSVGACCFQSGSNDCFLEDPLSCLAYEPCKALTA